MKKLKGWYKVLLVIWVVIALPSLVLITRFSVADLIPDLDFLIAQPASAAAWLLAWTFNLSPLLLLPFARKRDQSK